MEFMRDLKVDGAFVRPNEHDYVFIVANICFEGCFMDILKSHLNLVITYPQVNL